ncbi:uncharacterized protein LOC124121877 [Haliotis rufescens]|uniref:uncharacterized protein LOC124121877 n=1 Tax=Haliotis rufescens TaxID=6454 RepID=UPI00201ED128|nr:uncharacterized protein LOC124121877 [Haliotis rufescens]
MEYHTAAVTGLLYVLVIQLSTEASTRSPVRKPVLETSQSRPTDGDQYTLICNYDGRTADGDFAVMQVFWYRDSSHVFTSPSGRLVPDNASDLDGRVSVRTTAYQHNITISINASIDNGSVWWCGDEVTRQDSNNITIIINTEEETPASTSSSTAATVASSTTSSTTEDVTTSTTGSSGGVGDLAVTADNDDDDDQTSFISAIAGTIVAAIVIIALIVIVMRTTSRRKGDLREGTDILSESFDHQVNVGSKHEGADVNPVFDDGNIAEDPSSVMQENILYFRSSDVISLRPAQPGSPNNTELYAQIYKPMSASGQRVSTSDVFVEAIYASPLKIPRVQHLS